MTEDSGFSLKGSALARTLRAVRFTERQTREGLNYSPDDAPGPARPTDSTVWTAQVTGSKDPISGLWAGKLYTLDANSSVPAWVQQPGVDVWLIAPPGPDLLATSSGPARFECVYIDGKAIYSLVSLGTPGFYGTLVSAGTGSIWNVSPDGGGATVAITMISPTGGTPFPQPGFKTFAWKNTDGVYRGIVVGYASLTSDGLVSTGSQAFAGAKEFHEPATFDANISVNALRSAPGGTSYVYTTSTSSYIFVYDNTAAKDPAFGLWPLQASFGAVSSESSGTSPRPAPAGSYSSYTVTVSGTIRSWRLDLFADGYSGAGWTPYVTLNGFYSAALPPLDSSLYGGVGVPSTPGASSGVGLGSMIYLVTNGYNSVPTIFFNNRIMVGYGTGGALSADGSDPVGNIFSNGICVKVGTGAGGITGTFP